MDILYIAYSCDPYEGSEDKIGFSVPLCAQKNGHRVTVITALWHKGRIEEYKKHNPVDIRFLYVDIPKIYKRIFKGMLYSGRLNRWHRSALKAAKAETKERHYDIIHQITPVEFRSVGNYKKTGVPFVLGPIGGGESVPKGLKSYKKHHCRQEGLRAAVNTYAKVKYALCKRIKNCDCVLFANRETADFLGYKNPAVISEVALTPVFKKPNEADGIINENTENKTVFLTVGRLIYRKGHKLLLDAVKELPEDIAKRTEFRIIGRGAEQKHLTDYAKQNGLQNVSFVPYVPHGEIYKEYQNADVLIMPSIRETTGSVLMEALSYKIPVITQKAFGGAVIYTEKTANFFDGKTKEEYINSLKNQIERAVNNPQRLAEIKENLSAIIDENTWEARTNEYIKRYKECISDK